MKYQILFPGEKKEKYYISSAENFTQSDKHQVNIPVKTHVM